MDTDEAYYARQLFYQGSYKSCINTVSSHPTPSESLTLYAARSHIALGQYVEAMDLLSSCDSVPATAVTFLAEYSSTTDEIKRPAEEVVNDVRECLEALGDDADGVTRAVSAIILALDNQIVDACAIAQAGATAQDQECVAVLVQLFLSIDRLDLARKAYEAAKIWAQDSLLIQLCEAWIGLKAGGDGYQAAYYAYDEIAQLPSANNVIVLNGKAAAKAALAQWDEAEGPLEEASGFDANDAVTLANKAAFNVLSGRPLAFADAALQQLQSSAPSFSLVQSLEQQSRLFDEAASKYAVSAA